jgi:hypothetical protein
MAILRHHQFLSWARRSDVPAFLVCLLLLGISTAPNAPAQERPYQIKATFLVNFAQYVEWPPSAFPAEDSPFVFGVLGDNPFGTALKDLVEGEIINGRKATIEQYKSVQQIGRCQVLFISESERSRLPAIMKALKGRSILTVSDIETFSEEGGIIRFVMQNKIRFRINLAAAHESNLTISSKLLRLADLETAKTK